MDRKLIESLTKLQKWATNSGVELDDWINRQLDLIVRTPAQGVEEGQHSVPSPNLGGLKELGALVQFAHQ